MSNKAIHSTNYSEVETNAHIDEIFTCQTLLDYKMKSYIEEGSREFKVILDDYLKKKKAEDSREGECVCYSSPIKISDSDYIVYYNANSEIHERYCENCGYVFERKVLNIQKR